MGGLILTVVWLMLHIGNHASGDDAYLEWPAGLNNNPEGCLLFYTLCERLGFPMTRNRHTLDQSPLEQAGVLILLDPWINLHQAEQEHLKKWVAAGGILITDQGYQLFGFIPDPTRKTYTGAGADEDDRRLLKAIVSRLSTDTDAGTLQPQISRIAFEDRWHFSEDDFVKFHAASRTGVLFRDHSGIRILEYVYGQGLFICLAEYSFLTNKLIPYHDNSVLSANLIAYAASKAKKKSSCTMNITTEPGIRRLEWAF
jgi:hypothetical protein